MYLWATALPYNMFWGFFVLLRLQSGGVSGQGNTFSAGGAVGRLAVSEWGWNGMDPYPVGPRRPNCSTSFWSLKNQNNTSKCICRVQYSQLQSWLRAFVHNTTLEAAMNRSIVCGWVRKCSLSQTNNNSNNNINGWGGVLCTDNIETELVRHPQFWRSGKVSLPLKRPNIMQLQKYPVQLPEN